MTTEVTVHPSESFFVYQKMDKCSIAACNDVVTPLRCGLKKSLSHKRKLFQSSQVLEDDVSGDWLGPEQLISCSLLSVKFCLL